MTDLFERLERIFRAYTAGSETYRKSSRSYKPPKTEPKTEIDPKISEYFANLEISYTEDREKIKTAWKNLMRKYHPDLHQDDQDKRAVAHELTQKLNKAYKELIKYIDNIHRRSDNV